MTHLRPKTHSNQLVSAIYGPNKDFNLSCFILLFIVQGTTSRPPALCPHVLATPPAHGLPSGWDFEQCLGFGSPHAAGDLFPTPYSPPVSRPENPRPPVEGENPLPPPPAHGHHGPGKWGPVRDPSNFMLTDAIAGSISENLTANLLMSTQGNHLCEEARGSSTILSLDTSARLRMS